MVVRGIINVGDGSPVSRLSTVDKPRQVSLYLALVALSSATHELVHHLSYITTSHSLAIKYCHFWPFSHPHLQTTIYISLCFRTWEGERTNKRAGTFQVNKLGAVVATIQVFKLLLSFSVLSGSDRQIWEEHLAARRLVWREGDGQLKKMKSWPSTFKLMGKVPGGHYQRMQVHPTILNTLSIYFR